MIKELEVAEEQSRHNSVLTLQFCVNYGGRAEIVDAARKVAELAAAGRLDPSRLTEERFRQYLDEPEIPDVDLFVRSSGEQRTSNFLLWQSAYAELVFLDRLCPSRSDPCTGQILTGRSSWPAGLVTGRGHRGQDRAGNRGGGDRAGGRRS